MTEKYINRRLLYDTQSLTTDKLEAIEKSSKQKGYDYLDFLWLMV
jgi:sulfate adenylyltransferase subunit 1